MTGDIVWPEGRRFAFTVFDDTDAATLENVRPVYRLLADLGFRTTKSCWALAGDSNRGLLRGETLDDPAYRQWLVELESQGFEIGWHGATWHTCERDQTAAGLDRFAEVFGHDPAVAANHTGCKDAMYWGCYRLSGWRRAFYNVLTRFRNRNISTGHIAGDVRFWGDLCRRRIRYFRNFVFQEINTLKACPFMPYHDPVRPWVHLWFASSDGHDIGAANRCLGEANQDRLESEGGLCILYSHFAKGFCVDGALNSRFEELMTRLAKKGGWFVPVSTVLDHLLANGRERDITDLERRQLEWKWLREKIFIGTT
jgi:hypothetical protein